MLGFVFGVLCLFGLKRVLRGSGCGGWHRDRTRWPGGRRHRWFLWRILERLDTSPGQEKVIRAEVDKLIEHAHSVKRNLRASGDHLARAMRAESFDDAAAAEALAAQDTALRELRDAAHAALQRIHDALDPEQRERLADMLETGGLRGGPYRGWV